MYESFFELSRAPFSLASDPSCVYMTAAVRSTMEKLVFGVMDRRGCIVLTAEPGMGKTTMLRSFCHFLEHQGARSSLVAIPTIAPEEFLESVMLDLGIVDVPSSKARRLRLLEDFLLKCDEEDSIAALVVDEAHQLSDELLEEIRLLGNFEAGDRKLLQFVLAGQTELNDKLRRPDLLQFKQRIASRLTLSRLNLEDVGGYLRFRWSEAGGTYFPFTNSAVNTIAEWSGGIPRTINTICHNSLMLAVQSTVLAIDSAIVQAACRQLDLRPRAPLARPAAAGS